MGSFNDFLELELLDHVFNAAYTPAATVYLGLSIADPGDDGAGLDEPSGNGYIRKAIAFSAASSRSVTQNGIVQFNQASGPWGTLTHYGIFDAESGGNQLAHGALNESKVVISGNTPAVASTEVVISIEAAECSDYLADKLLDFALRNQAFSQPDTYVALPTATVGDNDTGSTITEPSGNGYAREQVEPNGGSSPTWDDAASGVVDNTHIITMGPPSGDWGTIVATAIVDAATDGNLLCYDNGTADEAIGNGDTVEFAAGALDISLD
jgi:hypothetical protein